jgi:hypothetical protein
MQEINQSEMGAYQVQMEGLHKPGVGMLYEQFDEAGTVPSKVELCISPQ